MTVHINPQGNVFHEGERRMHAKLGVSDRLRDLGARMIRDHMPDQHRDFFEMLRLVHLGAVDSDGHPWAITRTGCPGFIQSPDDKTLKMTSTSLAGEPQNLDLSADAKVSVLGLEMETRRRNRMNGTVTQSHDDTMTIAVDQSYGNCPKYIRTRTLVQHHSKAAPSVTRKTHLESQFLALVQSADILMLATRAPELSDDPRAGVDINHRGGSPGFVRVLDAKTLLLPDYKGNNFYNSYGNILLDDRVGLQFFDFETGALLNIKGTAGVIETGDVTLPFMGRALRICISEIVYAEHALSLRYEAGEPSPNNPQIVRS